MVTCFLTSVHLQAYKIGTYGYIRYSIQAKKDHIVQYYPHLCYLHLPHHTILNTTGKSAA